MSGLTSKSQIDSSAPLPRAETQQSAVWKGTFGREYSDRNTFDPEALDQLCRKNYGVTRRAINEGVLREIPRNASFLEVGCNTGNQLLLLERMGYSNLAGVEVQSYALEIARRRVPDAELALASALCLPYADSAFDVVFTSGVLIHISPEDLPRAMDEIYRCSRSYIWGLEYYAAEATEVRYRDCSGLLWKMDYARRYLERFSALKLVREQRLPYRENQNIDSVFLLRKEEYV